LSGAKLNVVNNRTDWDIPQCHCVTRTDISTLTAHHGVADRETLRRQNVRLLAVGVVNEGDAARAVRIVFNCCNAAGDTVFYATEIDNAVTTLVAATAVA